MSQFYFYHKASMPVGKDGKFVTKCVLIGINPNLVLRSVLREDGRMYIVMNDYHEEVTQVPAPSKNGNKNGYQNKREDVSTEFVLEGDDIQRFIDATQVGGMPTKPELDPELKLTEEQPQAEIKAPEDKVAAPI